MRSAPTATPCSHLLRSELLGSVCPSPVCWRPPSASCSGSPVLRLRGITWPSSPWALADHPHPAQHDHLTGGPNGISGIPASTLGASEFNCTVKDGALAPSTTSSASPQRQPQGDLPLPDGPGAGWRPCSSSTACCACRSAVPGRRCGKTDRLQVPGAQPHHHQADRLTIGACFAGFAGSFFASRRGFISPESGRLHRVGHRLAIVVLGAWDPRSGWCYGHRDDGAAGAGPRVQRISHVDVRSLDDIMMIGGRRTAAHESTPYGAA